MRRRGGPIERPRFQRKGPAHGPYLPTTLPKWDTLDRSRLPSTRGMSLQYEKLPSNWKGDVFEAFRTTVVVLCPIAFVASGIFGLLGHYLGQWLTSPVALPYWIATSAVLGLWAIFARRSAEEIALCFGLPFVTLLLCHLKSGELSKTSALLALAVTGLLADSVGTHYLYWLTAHPRLQVEERRRRRLHWWLRFISWPPFVGYPVGFGILVIYWFLYTKHAPLWMLWAVPALSLAWSLVWSLVLFNWKIWTPLVVAFSAYHSWLNWGRWEGLWGSRTPGLFRSPLGPYVVRLIFTGSVFVLIAAPFLQWTTDLNPMGGKTFAVWALHLAGSCFLPVPVLFATLLALLGPHLAREREAINQTAAKRTWQPEWMGYANQLIRSKHKLEREHFWVGVHAEASYPVLVHDKAVSEHVHILGDSGSGKTHRGLIPLLTQIIRRKSSGVVIIDLKGDEVMFQTMKAEAERQGLTFKWFTNIIGRSTYVFNPFTQVRLADISVNQMCELFLDAMRLNHGDGYGRSYFTRIARSWLSDILQKFPNLQTFDELYQKTSPEFFKGGAKEREDCYELVSVLQSLASVDQLNFGRIPGESDGPLKNAIFMPDVIKNNEVVYFYLPSSQESGTVREIANLAIFTLYTASIRAQKQSYLVIDEFQRVASRAFEVVLQQARSAGLAVLLANQTLADLKTADAPSLSGVVKGNTRLKLCFSATEPELQEELIRTSGETVYEDYFYESDEEKRTLREEGRYQVRVGPRANLNDILRYSAAEEKAICRLSRDSGFSQFGGQWFPIATDYAMSLDTFYQRKGMSWPKGKQDHTIKTQRVSRRYRAINEKKEAGQTVLGTGAPAAKERPAQGAQPTEPGVPSSDGRQKPEQKTRSEQPPSPEVPKGPSPRPAPGLPPSTERKTVSSSGQRWEAEQRSKPVPPTGPTLPKEPGTNSGNTPLRQRAADRSQAAGRAAASSPSKGPATIKPETRSVPTANPERKERKAEAKVPASQTATPSKSSQWAERLNEIHRRRNASTAATS